MKCMSCEMEINPQWKHAIDINICPFCGQGIMEEHLKNLFTSLRKTMESLLEYPQQLNDWMLSNHNYIKTDAENLIEFVPKELLKDWKKEQEEEDFLERKNKKFMVKVTTESGEEEVVAEKIQSEEKTNDFFKRAEAVKPNIDGYKSPAEKTEHLKKMAQQIKRAGASALTSETGAGSFISPEMMESADPEAVAEFQSLISGGEVASALPDNGGDDDIPSVVLAMANKAKGGNNDSSGADLDKLRRLQDRVSASRNNFASGAKGSFSRH
jgi:hypothetical protein